MNIHEQSASDLERSAMDLIDLALKLLPEGEGIDLGDQDYDDVTDIIRLRYTLTRIGNAVKEVNRALAIEWEERFDPDEWVELEGNVWSLGTNRKVVYIEGMEEAFGEWVKDQPAEKIAKIMPARSLRVTHMGNAARDTFLDTNAGKDGLKTIKYRSVAAPRKKAM
jgi:hypothetical protein